MFTRKVTLFRLFGFAIKADASWLFLAVLITWSLAEGLFPYMFPGLPAATYWWMGVAGAFGLFVSIVLHELGHSIVARRFGIPIKDITLFIFGGVSEMEDEPQSARDEFFMAIVGPFTSAVISVVLYVIFILARPLGAMTPTFAVIGYLAWLNGLLAIFNMLPAFPLDGGRVLRSILWGWKGDLRWSTRVASVLGSTFGIILMMLGVFSLLTGNFIGGLWWFLIGMFMKWAAQSSYRQLLVRKALEGETIRHFMRTDPVTVPSDISVETLVEDYIYHYHHRMFPVTDETGLLGCVSIQDVKSVPRSEWDSHSVGQIMEHCNESITIGPDEDPMKALALMSKTGNKRMMVVDEHKLVGVVSLSDLLKFLTIKMDLESGTIPPGGSREKWNLDLSSEKKSDDNKVPIFRPKTPV